MNLIRQLIDLADILDGAGFKTQADCVDLLIKQAAKTPQALIEQRFFNKVDKNGPIKNKQLGHCWIFFGARSRGGYGILTVNKKNYAAHKFSWELANGRKVPKGLVLLHKCDNGAIGCVRPSHLSPGTAQSNVDDRVLKDRSAKGEANGRARITEKDVPKIRQLSADGITEKQIADIYGVGRSTISHILKKHTWGWVE